MNALGVKACRLRRPHQGYQFWDYENYLAETNDQDQIQAVYTNEPQSYGNLISQYRKDGAIWTPSYYQYDALGSTRALTDDAGDASDTYVYDAWGNEVDVSGSTVNPFRWVARVGYYWDDATGTFYIRARVYEPVVARWMSQDPIGFVDGLNLYRYVSNSPTTITDAVGLMKQVFAFEGYGGFPGEAPDDGDIKPKTDPSGAPQLQEGPQSLAQVLNFWYDAAHAAGADIAWHYYRHNMVNEAYKDIVDAATKPTASDVRTRCSLYDTIVVLGYSAGGEAAVKLIRKLFNRVEGRITVDLVITADPHRAPGLGGAVDVAAPQPMEFETFPGWHKWINFYQRFDKGSLVLPVIGAVNLYGGTVKDADNRELKLGDFTFPANLPADLAADWKIRSHIGIPAVTKVTKTITEEIKKLASLRPTY